MNRPSDIAFTDSVKAIQSRKGSRQAYQRMYENVPLASGFNTEITQELRTFLARLDSVFLATVNAAGRPYIQHRGGPHGFLKVIDKHTLAFADYDGNRQYISQGNLQDNPKAFLFLIDYQTRSRIKVWGEAKVIENDATLLQSLMPTKEEYRASSKQLIQFKIHTWDGNCPQHIPLRMDVEAVENALHKRDQEIARLKQQIVELSK